MLKKAICQSTPIANVSISTDETKEVVLEQKIGKLSKVTTIHSRLMLYITHI